MMLQCPNCHKEFNSSENLPRIMVYCGHTFCQKCIHEFLILNDTDISENLEIETQRHEEQSENSNIQTTAQTVFKNQMECPECGTVNMAPNGLDSFPKNLVLLQVNQQAQQTAQLRSTPTSLSSSFQPKDQSTNNDSRDPQNQQQSMAPTSSQQLVLTDQKYICGFHSKKLEAFCDRCLETLCIDCILSDSHKSHEISSVSKAADLQRTQLFEHLSHYTSLISDASVHKQTLFGHISRVESQTERNLSDLQELFVHVRRLLDERERDLTAQLRLQQAKEVQDCNAMIHEVKQLVERVERLREESERAAREEPEIEMLEKAKVRVERWTEVQQDQRVKQVMGINITQIEKLSCALVEVRREQELATICKIINPQTKGGQIIAQTTQQNNQPSSTLYSHTQASKLKGKGTVQQTSNVNVQNAVTAQPQIQSQVPSVNIAQDQKKTEDLKRINTGRIQQTSSALGTNNYMRNKVSPHRNHAHPYPSSKYTNMIPGNVNKPNIYSHQTSGARQPTNAQNSTTAVVTILDAYNHKQIKSAGGMNLINKKSQQHNPHNGTGGGIMHHHINLQNLNNHQQQNQASQDEGDEAVITSINDDVSCIYPVESNDCYFPYSPKNLPINKGLINNAQDCTMALPTTSSARQTIDEPSDGGSQLNDLLEKLNKSSHQINEQMPQIPFQMATSLSDGNYASKECAKTFTDQVILNQRMIVVNGPTNKALDSPRKKTWAKTPSNANAQYGQQQQQQQATRMETTQSMYKNSPTPALPGEDEEEDPNLADGIYFGRQGIPGTAQKPNPNDQEESKSSHHLNCEPTLKTEGYDTLRKRQSTLTDGSASKHHQLSSTQPLLTSLSQERQKRKLQQLSQQTRDKDQFSPLKNNRMASPTQRQIEDREKLINMLQECSKNIEKIESNIVVNQKRRQRNALSKSPSRHLDNQSSSPVKMTSPTLVGGQLISGQIQPRPQTAAICTVDLTQTTMVDPLIEEEQSKVSEILMRKLDNEEGFYLRGEQDRSSPNLLESPENFGNHISQDILQQQDNPLTIELLNDYSHHQQILMSNSAMTQSCTSNDTSVAPDPFKALCRVKEEFIFVFSGFNDQKLMVCESFDVQNGIWKEICQITKARTKFSAVPISKSRILIFGGKLADGQRTGEIEEFNMKTNKFKVLPFKLPKARSGFASCVKKEEGKIFFCGGNSGTVLRKFDCLDLKKGKWSRCPDLLHKRDELAVALGPDGKVYAIGGYGGGSKSSQPDMQLEDSGSTPSGSSSSNCLRTAERFDFNSGQWDMLPEMNEARRALAAVALPDGIYAIGGYDGKQYLSSVEKFDLQKQVWVNIKPMNYSRCTLSAVASNDCQYIYAMGGFNGSALDLVERYNTMTDEWEVITPMLHKRFMHEAVSMISQ